MKAVHNIYFLLLLLIVIISSKNNDEIKKETPLFDAELFHKKDFLTTDTHRLDELTKQTNLNYYK